MSGQSIEDAISFSDDKTTFSEDELDVQSYGLEDLDDEDDAIIISDDEYDSYIAESPLPSVDPLLKTFEVPACTLEHGTIRPGTVVELKDNSSRNSSHLISGDFLLVRKIVEDVETAQISLVGYRMRRVEYIRPLFDRKFNDLFMVLEVMSDDEKPRFVQGLESVAPEEVVGIRNCVFTNHAYEQFGQMHANTHVPLRSVSNGKVREWLFHHGKLICRWVLIIELDRNGKSYAGEVRRMYKREVAADFSGLPRTPAASTAIHKCRKFTIADGFCGIGCVSRGAQDAGFAVKWGLDSDAEAMKAYRKNFPNAQHLEMDAHDFPEIAKRGIHGCDHLHMSCPCCYWSEMHTVRGVNDQDNLETLYTVEPWLQKLKPPTFSLEQAPGLLKREEHRIYFRFLLNGILNQGYGVRWTIQDQAWFGIAQHRRRLVFIGAKNGIPLPPFPAPRHGPPGSGLKRYVTIKDALRTLEQRPRSNDPYHQPESEKRIAGAPIDPHVNLARCITTSGGANTHYSGTRAYTCRELSQFQGLPLPFHFAGPPTQARKQCGNGWPAKSNKIYFELWAAHMEAYYAGLVGAEDQVLDLHAFLTHRGERVPEPHAIDLEAWSREPPPTEQPYRYLHKIEKTVRPRVPLQLWAKHREIDRVPGRGEDRAMRHSGSVGGRQRVRDLARGGVRRRRRREVEWVEDDDGNIVLD